MYSVIKYELADNVNVNMKFSWKVYTHIILFISDMINTESLCCIVFCIFISFRVIEGPLLFTMHCATTTKV